MNFLIDTCIFIDYLRGKPSVYDILNQSQNKLYMSSVTMMELLIGAFSKKEATQIQKVFQHIEIVHINQEISKLAYEYIATYSKSHNLQIPDALIGATSVIKNITLLSYNISDFQYIPNIKLYSVRFI